MPRILTRDNKVIISKIAVPSSVPGTNLVKVVAMTEDNADCCCNEAVPECWHTCTLCGCDNADVITLVTPCNPRLTFPRFFKHNGDCYEIQSNPISQIPPNAIIIPTPANQYESCAACCAGPTPDMCHLDCWTQCGIICPGSKISYSVSPSGVWHCAAALSGQITLGISETVYSPVPLGICTPIPACQIPSAAHGCKQFLNDEITSSYTVFGSLFCAGDRWRITLRLECFADPNFDTDIVVTLETQPSSTCVCPGIFSPTGGSGFSGASASIIP